jgi:hypothetical protein
MASLEAWAEAAETLFAPGCEAQSFVLLSSFAAPLMAFFPERGAVVSVWGGRKAGKSTALAAAASVWGRTPEEMVPVSLDYSIPAIWQNMAHRDPSVARRIFGAFLTNAGAHTILISATFGPLLSSLYGPEDQLPGIEFELKVPKSLIRPKDGNRIQAQMLSHRGAPAPVYSEYLARDNVQIWARRMLVSRYAAALETTGGGLRWHYAMRAIAAVDVAAIVVTELKILAFDPERIVRWALGQIGAKEKAA